MNSTIMLTSTEIIDEKNVEWTPYHDLSEDDVLVFDQATNGFLGLSHMPRKISTRLLEDNTFRYKFIAILSSGNSAWEAYLEINKPEYGIPYLYKLSPAW